MNIYHILETMQEWVLFYDYDNHFISWISLRKTCICFSLVILKLLICIRMSWELVYNADSRAVSSHLNRYEGDPRNMNFK